MSPRAGKVMPPNRTLRKKRLMLCCCAMGLGTWGQTPATGNAENTPLSISSRVSTLSPHTYTQDPKIAAPSSGINRSERPVALSTLENSVITRSAGSGGLVYTCDASISALGSVCNTLNTTIAAIYSGVFRDVNAAIYVKLGNSALGNSSFVLNTVTYTAFKNALANDQSSASDQTAILHLPASNPLNKGLLGLTNPNVRALPALAITPNSGFLADGNTFCTLGSAGCYDGVITISSSVASVGDFYFRTGPPIAANQFDFYTVIEHETDEILGTFSCAFPACSLGGSAGIAAADLFRYQSNGARSFAAGNNNACTSSNSGNACFSLDSIQMLEQYNNLNDGTDAGDWADSCSLILVQNAALCAGVSGVDISPAAEIKVLDVIGYSLLVPAKAGLFRNGYFWLLDVDGNRQWDSPPDRAFPLGGIAGDIPVTGDWTGDGQTKPGIYRASNGLFILGDKNGNIASVVNLGVGVQAGDLPVVGDWNGDGRTKVGLFRQGFFWILDYNGNGVFEQGIDKTYAFGGVAGDVPVVGDWTGSGVSKIGLFRQGFFWILDANGDGVLDNVNQTGGDQAFAFGGVQGDVPVVGDWNGSGTSKVGVFRSGFFWVLDANGNHQFDGTAPGQDLAFAFGGIAGDTPVVGKW
jgi:hypothetical protein